MKAAGVLILLATVAFSSVLPDSAAPQTLAKRTPRIPYEGLAIVVNANNPATDITLSQLRAMFLGEREWWSNRHRVVLAGMQRNTPEWHTVRRLIYKMDRRQLDHYYLYQSFKGESPSLPATMPAPSDVKKFVVSTPGALGTCALPMSMIR